VNLKSILLSFLITFSGVILADFYNGRDAYDRGDYKVAMEEWSRSAKLGDVDSQVGLAFGYALGKGVESDPKKSVFWFRKAAEQGDSTAQSSLGLAYEYGQGVTKNINTSIKWYKKAAKQGHKKAKAKLEKLLTAQEENSKIISSPKSANKEYDLGLNYYFGDNGVIKNKKKAFKWLYKSAKKGHMEAQFWIGWMYGSGNGVSQDKSKALKWYKKSANQGYSKAQTNLGLIYDSGTGVSVDYDKAIKWYRKAAKQNSAKAQNNLALLYEYGFGVEKNYKQSIILYLLAIENTDSEKAEENLKKLLLKMNGGVKATYSEAVEDYEKEFYDDVFPKFLLLALEGNAAAQVGLALVYGKDESFYLDKKQSVKWYTKAAEQGNKDAQHNLGYAYSIGKGVDKDYYEAIIWYRKAAEQGHPGSQHNLGYSYSNGKGLDQDYKQAVIWYRKAAEQNHVDAQYNLALLYEYGKGVDKDIDQALKWYRKSADQGDEDSKDQVKKLLALQGQDGQTNKYTVFSGSGTGFVVSKEGVVATNHHVIDNCGRIVVDEKDAKLILQDEINDLALIKVSKTYEKVSRLSYRSPALGSDISVFGYPLSDMMSEKHISLTKGSVSSLAGMDGNLSNFRFTAPVQPGNSGGPIVNKDGKVVGITRAVLGKTVLEKGDFLPQNVNFGIRSSLLINMMESKMIHVNDTPLKVEDIVKHYVKTTKYIKCYE